MAERNVLAD